MSPWKAADEGALLKAILQESASEVLVFDAASLLIVQANPSALANLKYGLKALQKHTPLDCLAPEDIPAFKTLLTLLRHGKKRRATLNTRCRRQDGTRYPVEARVFYSANHGRPVFIWIGNDVSLREATREALEHSESDLRAIVAHIPGMAFQVFRQAGEPPVLRYVSEQSAQLLGVKASALRADPECFARLILEEDRRDYFARLAAAPGGHLSFNWEGRLWMKAWKDVKWVAVRVSERPVRDGTVWDGIVLNVTLSKEAEAEIRRSRAQLSALAAHVEAVKEQERLNLAREVHDDLGGNLTTIKIGLSWLLRHLPQDQTALLERTQYLDHLVDQTFEAAHHIASNLRPAALDFGIVPALEWLLQRFGRSTDIAYELNAPEAALPLDPDAATAVFRIVQEALTNVAKHAQATRVRLKLVRERDCLRVTLTDNGRGLPAELDSSPRPAFGILGMTERATALRGELRVRPAPRRGTEVSLRVPLTTSTAPE